MKVRFCLFNQFVRFTLHLQNNHHVLNRYWGRSNKTILRLRITAKVSNHRVFGCGQFKFLSTDQVKPPCPDQTNILFLRDDKLLYFGAVGADIVTCIVCNDKWIHKLAIQFYCPMVTGGRNQSGGRTQPPVANWKENIKFNWKWNRDKSKIR